MKRKILELTQPINKMATKVIFHIDGNAILLIGCVTLDSQFSAFSSAYSLRLCVEKFTRLSVLHADLLVY